MNRDRESLEWDSSLGSRTNLSREFVSRTCSDPESGVRWKSDRNCSRSNVSVARWTPFLENSGSVFVASQRNRCSADTETNSGFGLLPSDHNVVLSACKPWNVKVNWRVCSRWKEYTYFDPHSLTILLSQVNVQSNLCTTTTLGTKNLWPLFIGSFMLKKVKMVPQNGGRCRQVVVNRTWSLTQVWPYYRHKQSLINIYRQLLFSLKNLESKNFGFHFQSGSFPICSIIFCLVNFLRRSKSCSEVPDLGKVWGQSPFQVLQGCHVISVILKWTNKNGKNIRKLTMDKKWTLLAMVFNIYECTGLKNVPLSF